MGDRCAGGVILKGNKPCSICGAGVGDQCARASLRDFEQIQLLRIAIAQAIDLLAERTYGNPARSAGHNARLCLEAALSKDTPSSLRLSERLADVVMMLDAPDAYNREYIGAVCRSILSSVSATKSGGAA